MALHEQGRLSSASGLEINPTFPIDPLPYSGMLPQTTLRSLPTIPVTTGIVSGTATTLATITQANVSGSAVADILVRVACNSTGHLFDSTRVGKYTLAISRVAGSALVATLSSVYGAAIATSGTDTLTFSIALAAVSGGVTATNTIAIQITVIESGGFTSEAQLSITAMNSQTFGPTIA